MSLGNIYVLDIEKLLPKNSEIVSGLSYNLGCARLQENKSHQNTVFI